MKDILGLTGLFGAAAVAAYTLTKLFVFNRGKKKAGAQRLSLKNTDTSKRATENALVRFKTSTALYRTRLVAEDESGFVIAAPLSKNSAVIIEPGEKVVCEIGTNSGVLQFSSYIVSRDPMASCYRIARPISSIHVDRRFEARTPDPAMNLLVNRRSTILMNVSDGGAQFQTSEFLHTDDEVLIQTDQGWICKAVVVDAKIHNNGCTARVKFAQPMGSDGDTSQPSKKEMGQLLA